MAACGLMLAPEVMSACGFMDSKLKKQGRVSMVRVSACKITSASEVMAACGIMEDRGTNTSEGRPAAEVRRTRLKVSQIWGSETCLCHDVEGDDDDHNNNGGA